MIGSFSGRWLAAGALALHALVAVVVLPLHGILDVAGPRTSGVSVDADCRDRGCHDSTHRHPADRHDPATCATCAQARAAAAPAPAVAIAEAVLVRIGGTEPARSAILPAAGRPRHAARAPPVLS